MDIVEQIIGKGFKDREGIIFQHRIMAMWIKEETLDRDIAEPSFINVNDKTIEGVHYLGKNVQTVQFHPEACAGPLDTGFLFDEFMNMMEVSK